MDLRENGVTGWHKSSYSGNNGGDCVEVGDGDGFTAVRDTKNRQGGFISVSPDSWRAFITGIKDGTVAR